MWRRGRWTLQRLPVPLPFCRACPAGVRPIPTISASARRLRAVKPEGLWPRGRELRVRSQGGVLGHKEGWGRSARAQFYFSLFLRACLGVNPRRVVTGDPVVLSSQLLQHKKAIPQPCQGRARACSGWHLLAWSRTGPGSRITRQLRPEASGQQKPSRGWRRPRMVPVVARGSRAPEVMAQNSQLACPFLRPAAQRAGRSLNPNPECPEGDGTPPPSRANSRLLQTACRSLAFVLVCGRGIQEESTWAKSLGKGDREEVGDTEIDHLQPASKGNGSKSVKKMDWQKSTA